MKKALKNVIKNIIGSMPLLSNDPKKLDLLSQRLSRFTISVNDKIRKLASKSFVPPEIISFNGTNKLAISIQEDHAPWSDIVLTSCQIPGMITKEESQYYSYIGQFYQGIGELVELGPWLGKSTFYILQGLIGNSHFSGKKLHVYDDFVWRSSWMDEKVLKEGRLENHQDFKFLFDNYLFELNAYILANKRKIIAHDGNEEVPQLVWNGGLIEIMYVDCGRTYEVNEAWYEIFSGSFIPGTTLIIMEDWGTHREVPVKWYNQIKQFTDSKGSRFQLIHELKDGHMAVFLYR